MVANLTSGRFGFGRWRESSDLRRLLVLSLCLGAVLGALQANTYGRVLTDSLRDRLGIGSAGLWVWIISSLIWSVILVSVAAVMLRRWSVRSDEEKVLTQNRIIAIFLSITAVVIGFCTGPFFGLITKFLPFFDLISRYAAVEGILAYLRLDFVHVLNLFWSVILAALGYGLARRPPLAAAFAGFCLSLYAATLAIIVVDDVWLDVSGSDEHSPQLTLIYIGLLGLCGISMTVGGYRLGGWLQRPG